VIPLEHRRSHHRRWFGFGLLTQNGVREREPERLMRIVVVGTSGAGKTTLARKIAALLELLHIELDAINWQSGWRDLTPDGGRPGWVSFRCASPRTSTDET
jgi:hypothetical protein